jgi:predicted SPOUT superfamily RNA methylase MTH1
MSIAIPGSVVSNCQTRELRTQLVGQIARAATVYQIDEIIVFDDKLAGREQLGYFRGQRSQAPRDGHGDQTDKEAPQSARDGDRHNHERVRSDPHTFMARLLQYCECPQYLRKHFFPMHPDLQFSGLLAPIDAPHHVRVEERSKYREGVVLDKKGSGPDAGSFVNCGIRGRPIE